MLPVELGIHGVPQGNAQEEMRVGISAQCGVDDIVHETEVIIAVGGVDEPSIDVDELQARLSALASLRIVHFPWIEDGEEGHRGFAIHKERGLPERPRGDLACHRCWLMVVHDLDIPFKKGAVCKDLAARHRKRKVIGSGIEIFSWLPVALQMRFRRALLQCAQRNPAEFHAALAQNQLDGTETSQRRFTVQIELPLVNVAADQLLHQRIVRHHSGTAAKSRWRKFLRTSHRQFNGNTVGLHRVGYGTPVTLWRAEEFLNILPAFRRKSRCFPRIVRGFLARTLPTGIRADFGLRAICEPAVQLRQQPCGVAVLLDLRRNHIHAHLEEFRYFADRRVLPTARIADGLAVDENLAVVIRATLEPRLHGHLRQFELLP